MILLRRIEGRVRGESTLQNRIYWAVFGIREIIDGVIKVVTFGTISSYFSYEMAKNRLQRCMNRHKREKGMLYKT